MRTAGRLAVALVTATTVVVCLRGAPLRATEPRATEYEVKATFLFNFLKFASWPDSALRPGGTLDICAFGDSSVADQLQTFHDRVVDGHRVNVQPVVDPSDLPFCHVVFLAEAEHRRVATVLGAVVGSPVLTVGEQPDFLERGGIINFVTENSRVRFDINQSGAERVNVKISAHLLRLARKTSAGRQP